MSAPTGPPSAGPGGGYSGQSHAAGAGAAPAAQSNNSASDLNKIATARKATARRERRASIKKDEDAEVSQGDRQAALRAEFAELLAKAAGENVDGKKVEEVTDYLLKKGFTKTEAAFRRESSNLAPDGRPNRAHVNDMGPEKYLHAYHLLKNWVDGNLDIYKFELSKLLWPVFVYSYLRMIDEGLAPEAKDYLEKLRPQFEKVHADDLRTLSTVTLPVHILENQVTKLYRDNKYRIPLNSVVDGQLWSFLEREDERGGAVIHGILNTSCKVEAIQRGPIEPFSFEAIFRRVQNIDLDEADVHEGIPGVFTGVSNKDVLNNAAALKLGPMKTEVEMREEVRDELEILDQRRPPAEGVTSLTEEFDQKIKREDSVDGPTRQEIPLPPSRARDVVMEISKVRENRDRFKIEGRTGGVGIPVSVCMFTFHNTSQSVSSMAFSKDHVLAAYGSMDSYIRVWSLDGKPLKSTMDEEKTNNRKLIGHSAPVYGLSFSDSIHTPAEFNPYQDEAEQVPTDTKLLLSSSADGTVRLWSLELWACLCVYKAHDGPVFRVLWGPHGHYFATAGWDKTVRIFMQDHASAQRILVGHDTSISAIAWHPNGAYVFSASDETDKSIRMWSITKGECLRVFTGHADYISSLACAPNGKILASGDTGGNIFFWDLETGTRIKRSRGHGKGGIPCLSFSAESNVLCSGGLDGTVRIWDVDLPKDASKAPTLGLGGGIASTSAQAPADGTSVPGDTVMVGGGQERSITVGGGQTAPTPAPAGASGSGGTGKKKGKEVMVTADQISAFPTKKTPVLRAEFTRMNLIIAGGCFEG